ncbi:hypothetical protein [Halobacillus andaensis]|uniref:hypothetical protein n=1 Tax=Halobacillus andaensis TaxID=1176239 RepID=UPI003D745E90
MNSHMLIEPDQLIKMQMHHSSKVYKHYHSFLRTTSNKPAAELTKDFCLNSSFTSIDDQLACYEFLYMNDYLDELTTLLQSSCQHLEAVYLYETLLKIGREPMSMDDLKSFESLSFEHPSLKCFHLFSTYLYVL